jgi:hypothetical protein
MYPSNSTAQQPTNQPVVLTPAMIQLAKQLQNDPEKAKHFLIKAGLLNPQGQLAKEYTACSVTTSSHP